MSENPNDDTSMKYGIVSSKSPENPIAAIEAKYPQKPTMSASMSTHTIAAITLDAICWFAVTGSVSVRYPSSVKKFL